MNSSPASILYDGYDNPIPLYDLDLSPKIESCLGVSLRFSAPTGSVPAGTQNNPLYISSSGYGGQIEGKTNAGNEPSGYPIYVAGYDGYYLRSILTDNIGRIIIAPSGTSSTSSGFAFGDILLAATTISPIRRTAYTNQTVNFTGSIASSSTSDTSAGVGVRSVQIKYLDQNCNGLYYETVILNGTSNVNLINNNHCFIESIEVISVGSSGAAVGTITLKNGLNGTGTVVGTIKIGDNTTFWSHHFVPINKVCYITSCCVGSSSSVAGNGSVYFIKSLKLDSTTAPEKQVSDFITLYGQSSQISRNYGVPIKIIGPTRLIMYVQTQTTSSITYRGSFDFYDQ